MIIQLRQSPMDFATCQGYFRKLMADCALPPKMETKLRYLQLSITRQDSGECLRQLPEFQQESLREMNIETQKAMFLDIIHCFAASENREHFKGIKAKVKRIASKSDSAHFYLNCIGNTLTLSKRKDGGEKWKEFKLESIDISSLYQKAKKKYTFTLKAGERQYEVRFEEERTCASIHGQLWNLVNEYKSPQEKRRYEKNLEEEIKQQDTFMDQQAYFIEEERNYLRKLKKSIQGKVAQCEGSFKLLRNINHGKMEVHPNGNVRLLLFVERCEIRRYIESFILLNCWNTEVETFRILKNIRPNTYLAYILLKKISRWTAQREAYVSISYLKDCACLQEDQRANEPPRSSYRCSSRHYIMISTVDYEQAPQTGHTRMKFSQIAEFSQFQDKKDHIFVSLTSDVDLNSYSILANKVEVNENLLKDVPALSILYKQRLIQNVSINIFDFDRCACKLPDLNSQIVSQVRQEQKQAVSESRVVSSASIVNNLNEAVVQAEPQSFSHSVIMKVINDQGNDIKNQKIIQVIKQRLFERYYLKQHFDLKTYEQPYIQSNFTLDHDTDFLIQGGKWKFNAKDEYVFTDEEELKIQKGMLKLLIKQITSNILAGKSIMTMSLPVEIFGTESLLEGLCRCFGFVPKYMHQAVQTKDPLEQIKNVAAAFMFIFACHPRFGKPFNPILGETYQGIIGGIPVFVEQISHHPPISAFYMRNDKFQAYGNFDMHVQMGLNAAFSKNRGLYYVRIFETDSLFVIRFPDVQVGGVMIGDRTLSLSGRGYILQKKTNIYLEYAVGKQKKKLYESASKVKSSEIIGGIFRVNPQFAVKAVEYDIKKTYEGAKPNDIVERLSQVSGKWYGDLFFDGVQYKSLKNGPYPISQKRQKVLLPSDSLFRQDVVYKRWGDNKRSNEQKQILENLQRRDKKLRTQHK